MVIDTKLADTYSPDIIIFLLYFLNKEVHDHVSSTFAQHCPQALAHTEEFLYY